MTTDLRRICYVSGTRADFGLMQSTLQAIHAFPGLALDVVATGMHLSERFGFTVQEIEAAGLNVAARIPTEVDASTGAAMALGLAVTLAGCVAAFERLQPDVVLLLGDRGEMMAGALAAIHLNIPLVHVHGGERTGSIDESIRHAISKLAHFHFTATQDARERLIKMGENPAHIFVTGAPGLDGLDAMVSGNRLALCNDLGFDPSLPLGLFLFHPVVQESDKAAEQAESLLHDALAASLQLVVLAPNADAGGLAVRAVLERYCHHPSLRFFTHLPRSRFVTCMAFSDVMIGNSSSGIIEAATFGTPVINVGPRQNLRERNTNVIDVPTVSALNETLRKVLQHGRFACGNCYGDGASVFRIVNLLATLPLGSAVLEKVNAY